MRRCKFGKKCRNIGRCPFEHAQDVSKAYVPCKFGQNCLRLETCPFYHPWVDLPISEPIVPKKLVQRAEKPRKQKYNSPASLECHKKDSISEDRKEEVQGPRTIQKCEQTSKKSFPENNCNDSPQQKSESDMLCNYEQVDQILVCQQTYLQSLLQDFFNWRLLTSQQFAKIYTYLDDKLSTSLYKVQDVLQVLEKIECNPHIMNGNFSYLSLIKTIVKNKMDLDLVTDKLEKKMAIKQKKIDKDQELLSQYPQLIPYQVLDAKKLVQTYKQQMGCKFLIDGNNVLPTHKIFRKYLKSRWAAHVIEGQLRFRWLVSEIKNCALFYDKQYVEDAMKKEENYWKICQQIMDQQELEGVRNQQCYFAKKQLIQHSESEGEDSLNSEEGEGEEESTNRSTASKKQDPQFNTADDMIFQHLKQFILKVKKMPVKSSVVALITADRVLIQKCLQLAKCQGGLEILISSGKQFIKMCKDVIRTKYRNNKIKKRVLKRIFKQLQSTKGKEQQDDGEEQSEEI